ncbi:alkaline phosphatase [Robertkochia solimangrovi]|uniref:alkaline phosphatase n=1 Tax=Robertkochia solimangrovi TaxID=2213046 RepID=UPI00117E45AF|nr:alkaline phosphatase [Robertkochia solimangrovi]TRZ42861.1 alkaline phosphatase [Robertkochia solimangrovi]
MNRRNFFRNGSLFTLGTAMLHPFQGMASNVTGFSGLKSRKARNIIMVISDGMSTGTLNMADIYLSRRSGKGTRWLELYKENMVSRALMDMASANSIVTDSAAASSSWGGGVRIPNGSLNMSREGESFMPIWQKFKSVGKSAGCVTTVPVTHATPAGFCVNQKSRSDQESIAVKYLEHKFDVLLGGGNKYFDPEKRSDGKPMYREFEAHGYTVVKSRSSLLAASNSERLLGVFEEDALPYSIDLENNSELKKKVPTLAEMTEKAIDILKVNPEGFVLQVEAGKVDWAAHGNDIGGLIHDQIAHDEALDVVIKFAMENDDTLVIITTDHGNANPGIIYGDSANKNFDSIQKYRHSNDWILNGVGIETSIDQFKDRVQYANAIDITTDEAASVLNQYKGIGAEDGLYNPRHLPFQTLAEIQKKYNSVGWISMQHSADYVELAMYGPGSQHLKPFIKNTDLHYLMLKAAEVENDF